MPSLRDLDQSCPTFSRNHTMFNHSNKVNITCMVTISQPPTMWNTSTFTGICRSGPECLVLPIHNTHSRYLQNLKQRVTFQHQNACCIRHANPLNFKLLGRRKKHRRHSWRQHVPNDCSASRDIFTVCSSLRQPPAFGSRCYFYLLVLLLCFNGQQFQKIQDC